MSTHGNTLVVHVISARDLHIRGHKPLDVYVSLSTSGRGPWKSKVCTNPVRVEPPGGEQQQRRETRWDEHCEFQLNDSDTRLVLHLNHKTPLLGTTETLGELVLNLAGMARFQPAAWFPLAARGHNSQEPRGQIQLGYQFTNRLAPSVSNMSLNKLEKEKKFDHLRRKMQQLGRSKKARPVDGEDEEEDGRSLASISIAAGASRRSSVCSSTNSAALAFSSPSPNAMARGGAASPSKEEEDTPHPFATSARAPHQYSILNDTEGHGHGGKVMAENMMTRAWDGGNGTTASALQSEQSGGGAGGVRAPAPMDPAPAGEFDRYSMASAASSTPNGNNNGGQQGSPTPSRSNKLKVKMRQKAEQLLLMRGNGNKRSDSQQLQPQVTIDDFGGAGHSRRGSIASSSGFVSQSSGHAGALNEHTSPDHLLSVITHLRRELRRKEERIRDLEDYTDRLVMKVMMSNPELLCQPPASSQPTSTRLTIRR